ncbi:MAG: acetolactate synthase 2 catalytic subunit, partial [Pseudomonadota bacterium]
MISGADYLIKTLEAHQIKTVFGYPGGAIMPVYDALVDSSIQHILCRHEQAAALAADGFARASGKVGVCIATSGPGATNLLTGIANAYLDSVPMLVITGQVATSLIGTDAFQEVDVIGLTFSIVKHSYLIENLDDLPAILEEAFALTQSGRPGPVIIDIPKNIQVQTFHPFEIAPKPKIDVETHFDLDQVIQCLSQAKRPVIYHGGGIQISQATEQLRTFTEATDIPCVHTLRGIGNLPYQHSHNMGMIGMHGLEAANITIQNSDCLLVLGARFDDRATGKLEEFAPHAQVIHVDTDAAELDKLRETLIAIRSDVKPFLNTLNQHAHFWNCSTWLKECQTLKETYAWNYNYPHQDIYVPDFLRQLSIAAGPNTLVSCDVGQHQMWVAQHYQFYQPYDHLSSGGLGTMGYGLPAAIGAQFSRPHDRVINISGDGSFMMNVQELATIKRYKLPVKIIIIDNQSLGMVRQWQTLFFSQRYSEIDLSDNPDFTQLAACF